MGHHSEEEARRLYRRQTRRRFLTTCGPAVVFALAGASRPEEARALDGGSSRKNLTRLRATVRDGEVQLSAYKSTPAFEDAASQQRFRALRVYRRVEPGFTFGQDYEEYFDIRQPAGLVLPRTTRAGL